MSIPEDMIMDHLGLLMNPSDPGDSIHHLHVVAAPAGSVGPLGFPPQDQLGFFVYLIAPADADQLVVSTIARAGAEHARDRKVVLFAGLSQEMWMVKTDGPDAAAEATRLKAEGRLFEHPTMAEVTVVYGACRDGRRWRGRRWVTGPRAGQADEVQLLVGRPDARESELAAVLLRRLVGLRY